MELFWEIASHLDNSDLHTLTCVSRRMATIISPLYLKKCNLDPNQSSICVSLQGNTFFALPVWCRSLYFVPKPILSCLFDGALKNLVDAQIRHLQLAISSVSPKSKFDEIQLWGDISPDMLWALLEVIDRVGFRKVDIWGWRTLHVSQDTGADERMQLFALESLSLHYSFLTPSGWATLLKCLIIPKLQKLDIVVDVFLSSLSGFLLRHPGIQEIRLRNPSGGPFLLPRNCCRTLELPALEVLTGSWRQVLPLLQHLPTAPRLRLLTIEPIADLPYCIFVDNIIQCLTLCEGNIHLDIGFHPSEGQSGLISSVNPHAISIRRLQSMHIRACVNSLRIRVQNLSDENILVRSLTICKSKDVLTPQLGLL